MPIRFEKFSISDLLPNDVEVPIEETKKISGRLKISNRRLSIQMKTIDRKEKKSWQQSNLRNTL